MVKHIYGLWVRIPFSFYFYTQFNDKESKRKENAMFYVIGLMTVCMTGCVASVWAQGGFAEAYEPKHMEDEF